MNNVSDRRAHLRRDLRELTWVSKLVGLPLGVARFQWRARRLARRTGDAFSLTSATRPSDLVALLEVARGCAQVVELGTATGWTAISLALADPTRQVVSYDVVQRPEPTRYMGLVDPETRRRIQLVIAPGSSGPRDRRPVDLLYIDSSHDRAETIAEVAAWRRVIRPGGMIVFDDFTHAGFPGVREAITELGLSGEQRGTMFVHRS